MQREKFLNWIGSHYDEQLKKMKAYCLNKKQSFDPDIFQDCIIKIVNKIEKEPLQDDSEKGLENYFFMTFKTNIIREKLYAAYQKRDENAHSNLAGFNEIYLNRQLTAEEKLLSDLKKDFSCIYILERVAENFDTETNRLFKMKLFNKLTYKQLAEKTGIKGVRQKVVEVKQWLKNNVTKEEINNAFYKKFGESFLN